MNSSSRKPAMNERLDMAKRSQASSPEAAAALVERFSKIHPSMVFVGRKDCDLMYDLTGAFWDELGEDSRKWSYSGFCSVLRRTVENDFEPRADLPPFAQPLMPALGERVNNAMILLGLMLLDHAKGRTWPRTIYHCTHMTMKQYLDALEKLACPRKDGPERIRFRAWRGDFEKEYDVSEPVAEVLAGIIRSYMEQWQELDHLDHLLRCAGALACYLECMEREPLEPELAQRVRKFRETLSMYDSRLEGWELVEADKRFENPCGYYFGIASEYPDWMPDPGDSRLDARAIRTQIYIPREEYETGLLPLLADLCPSPDIGELLRKYGDPERLVVIMDEIHREVLNLYMLWVEPYLSMEELRSGKEAETDLMPG